LTVNRERSLPSPSPSFFKYAVKSDLPKAKHFVYHFPEFLLSLQKGEIQPPKIQGFEPFLLKHPTIPKRERGDHIRSSCAIMGWTLSKYYRELKKAEKTFQVRLARRWTKRKKGSTHPSKTPGDFFSLKIK